MAWSTRATGGNTNFRFLDKMGVFQKDIAIKAEPVSPLSEGLTGGGTRHSGSLGSAAEIAFSPDRDQKYIYDLNEDVEQIQILDRATGEVVSAFGRAGHQLGEFTPWLIS